jgi:hypothetical protein
MGAELITDLVDHRANAFGEFVALEVLSQDLLFSAPELKTHLFMDARIAPDGKMARFGGQVDQHGIPVGGVEHTEQLEYFSSPFNRLVAETEVFHVDPDFSGVALFGVLNGPGDVRFFYFGKKHCKGAMSDE